MFICSSNETLLPILNSTCNSASASILNNPQILAAFSTTLGVAISGIITVFVARHTIRATERNAKLAILDRQYEALRAAIANILVLTYDRPIVGDVDDLRTKCLALLTLLAPNTDSHQRLRSHIDSALNQLPPTDWGINFFDLAQKALSDSMIRKAKGDS